MPRRAWRPAAGAGAVSGHRRHRPDGGERTDGGGAGLAARFRHAATARLTIASTSRSYLIDEKIAMGDGRYDRRGWYRRSSGQWRAHVLIDLDAIARGTGAMINAVMLGAIAGCGRLPIPVEAFEARDSRRRQGGRGQPARLPRRPGGCAREIAAARRQPTRRRQRRLTAPSSAPNSKREIERAARPRRAKSSSRACAGSAAYQDLAYARLYLDRLATDRRRRRARTRRRATSARDGAASRGAHVLRGRDPRRAGQDRSIAHGAHQRATWA